MQKPPEKAASRPAAEAAEGILSKSDQAGTSPRRTARRSSSSWRSFTRSESLLALSNRRRHSLISSRVIGPDLVGAIAMTDSFVRADVHIVHVPEKNFDAC